MQLNLSSSEETARAAIRTYSIRWKKHDSNPLVLSESDEVEKTRRGKERGEIEVSLGSPAIDLSSGLEAFVCCRKSESLIDSSVLSQVHNERACDEDIEDIVIPLERFKKKGKLSVTDFSAQLWCEKQLEFILVTGKKRFTEAMKKGVARHELLELEDHEVVEVQVETREDELGLRLLNTITLLQRLQTMGRAREIWICGIVDGVVLSGVIDELEIRVNDQGFQRVVIGDTKTRSEEKEPSNAQQQTTSLQLQIYRFMVNQLRSRKLDLDFLFQVLRCDPEGPFTHEYLKNDFTNLRDLASIFNRKFSGLPPLEEFVEVVYECNSKEFLRKSIPYSEISTLYVVHDLLDWWRGIRREAQHVMLSERWKCRWCDFVGQCPVTPLTCDEVQKALELRSKETTGSLIKETACSEINNMKTADPLRRSSAPPVLFHESIQENGISELAGREEAEVKKPSVGWLSNRDRSEEGYPKLTSLLPWQSAQDSPHRVPEYPFLENGNDSVCTGELRKKRAAPKSPLRGTYPPNENTTESDDGAINVPVSVWNNSIQQKQRNDLHSQAVTRKKKVNSKSRAKGASGDKRPASDLRTWLIPKNNSKQQHCDYGLTVVALNGTNGDDSDSREGERLASAQASGSPEKTPRRFSSTKRLRTW